ncbi:DegT/DnrJ/EryC1/StrS family aminotransferase [Paenibacillus agricola]|uniref:Pyridoxal phosphate-dependent aminotransferase n=1 Tax=Paenibacillus agricola TaxID=2716264 RepID=A0ABX0J2P1_9BACL|nr:DegT/DnrJ/EryC1/StrS family aminotransferase [Paenibacillus agricola]NHN29389.1 pyridoxal phosphate-dependent aminotransferase [Paenibacillus agricola]
MKDWKRIYLSPPHMGEQERELILDAFASNWIAPLGPHVESFEQEMAAYVGVRGALALSSGTSAIHLGLRLLDVGQGDLVFCSSLTFIASANPIVYQGAEPVFIDSEPDSWNMSPQALQQAFDDACLSGRMPKAVIVVHLYGQNADMDVIKSICDAFGIPIIEDAAESLGATYKDRMSGTIGKVGIYSFSGNKIITTSSGGMIVSDDELLIKRARFLATQAREPTSHYQHCELGYNYRMSNLLAAVGRGQLIVLDDRVDRRRAIFQRYQQGLGTHPGVSFMPEMSYGRANRWLTVMLLDMEVAQTTPGKLIEALAEQNIEARPLWKPLHLQPLYANSVYYPHSPDESISEQLFHSGICLPSGSNLSEEEQNRVMGCISSCFAKEAVKNFG